ncbi:GTP-binding protein [Acorus calamus]|uniref:GTP-binding protein n=1 Tax=Acorus calamus TaxID=4465 RepID=A0AAV9FBE2_ACOCL|nr:GTP-binding protein [Acorus calamus]
MAVPTCPRRFPSLPSTSLFASPFSRSSRRKEEETAPGKDGNEDDDEASRFFVFNRDPKSPPRLFVVQPRLRPDSLLQPKLSEALNLASSLEERREGDFGGESVDKRELPPHLVVQNPVKRSIKSVWVGCSFVNTILTGIQQRNLEREWGKPVLDRVSLIIEIFNAHAQTKEAKLQSELAALMYRKTRLVRVRGPDGRLTFGASGEAEVVSARGRSSGGRGFISGAGETELQLQRRRIQERRSHLLTQIEEVRRTRALQRSSRKRHGGSGGLSLSTVAVVGLFATVDPRLRSVILPSGRKVLLSDTVGFISDLPVQLVEAFHATLEEVVEADLLVHVLDSSAPNLDDQRSSVLQVLQQIGVSKDKLKNMIEVWNKIDLLEKTSGADEKVDEITLDQVEENEIISFEEGGVEVDEKPSELSYEEPIFEDGMAVELSSEDGQSTIDGDQKTKSSEMVNEEAEQLHQNVQRVKTSAVTGVGLQELLHLIDEKLDETKSSDKRILEPFNHKWRPSYSLDSEKAAEQ